MTISLNARLPDFLILGAAKSGTTSLYYYLGQHPQLYFPPEVKEPGYLCFAGRNYEAIDNDLPDMWRTAITEQGAYEKLFLDAPPDSHAGEATPEYLFLANQTVVNIKNLYGEQASKLKFIAILRNPIERIWSHFWMMKRDGYENLPYSEATDPSVIAQRINAGWHPAYDYLGYGYYGQQLKVYFKHFKPEQFHVLLFEDFKSNPLESCQSIFAFLGVDSSFSPDVSIKHNLSGELRFNFLHKILFIRESLIKSVMRHLLKNQILQFIKSRIMKVNTKKIDMPQDEKIRLSALYHEDILSLSKLINRDLSHWLNHKSG